MGELLPCFEVLERLSDLVSNELGTVVVSYDHALEPVSEVKQAHQADHVGLADALLKYPTVDHAAEDLEYGQLVVPSVIASDPLAPTLCAESLSAQQPLLLHQPVGLLFVDVVAPAQQLSGDHLVSIGEIGLGKDLPDLFHHGPVGHQPVLAGGMDTRGHIPRRPGLER